MGYNIQYPSGVVCIVNLTWFLLPYLYLSYVLQPFEANFDFFFFLQAMPTYSQTPKSVNPFDLTSDPAAVVW